MRDRVGPIVFARILWLYFGKFGRLPNLRSPRTFNEKVTVNKLTWRSPLLPIFVDKVKAKQFIAEHSVLISSPRTISLATACRPAASATGRLT